MLNADFTRDNMIRYVANAEFTEAMVYFRDGSFLQFVHKTRDERWARPSADDTTAGRVCRALRLFRLNAKHLQLFFEDGSDVEVFATPKATPASE
jgi:hypothetical protein